jgi:hypothetical protein
MKLQIKPRTTFQLFPENSDRPLEFLFERRTLSHGLDLYFAADNPDNVWFTARSAPMEKEIEVVTRSVVVGDYLRSLACPSRGKLGCTLQQQ